MNSRDQTSVLLPVGECGGGAKRGFAAAGQQQKFSTKATLLGFRAGLVYVVTEKIELFSLSHYKTFLNIRIFLI